MALRTIEISVRGRWVNVPAVSVGRYDIVVRGKWLKQAVINSEEWLETELEEPEACIKVLKAQRHLRADILTFTQKVPATVRKYPYPVELDSVAVAQTGSFKMWWESLPQETRKNVRRAQKRGVIVKVKPYDDEMVGGIMEINNDSAVRQNAAFVHYGKSFDQVKKDHASFADRSDFICAYAGEEIIGFLKLVYRGQTASILQLLPKASHADKRPANALIAKAVELCEARGVTHLTYGMYNYGNKRDSPLREFKIRNGFSEMLIPRYYVPLTPWGTLCMKLKLHLGLLGILPPGVVTMGLRARTQWHRARQTLLRA